MSDDLPLVRNQESTEPVTSPKEEDSEKDKALSRVASKDTWKTGVVEGQGTLQAQIS